MRDVRYLQQFMINKNKENTVTSLIPSGMFLTVILLVALYFILMLIGTELGPRDEYNFLPTLQRGLSLPSMFDGRYPYTDINALGRFMPLAMQEFNLIGYLSNKPFWYFFAMGIELVVFIVIYNIHIKEFITDKFVRHMALIVVLLSPGFVTAFFEIPSQERQVVVLLIAFLLCYTAFSRNRQPIAFFASLLFANLSIYYKEPVFVAIAAFAFSHMILTWRERDLWSKVLDGLLMASAAVFLALYVILVIPKQGVSYIYSTENPLLVLVRNVANYSFYSDPIPLLLLCPLAGWRMYILIKGKEEPHPILDPLGFAGAAYVGVYLVLNIYGPYFLFPAWVMAIPPLLYFYLQKRPVKVFWRAAFFITVLVFLVNTVPFSAYVLTYDKYLPINFNHTTNFLVADIKHRYPGERANIFLDSIDRDGGRATYFIFGEYLKSKGLTIVDFDMRSVDKNETWKPLQLKPSPFDSREDIDSVVEHYGYKNRQFPYTLMQPGGVSEIKKGDYLVVTPENPNNIDKEYIAALEGEYDLLFATKSPFAIPSMNAKAVVKMLVASLLGREESARFLHTRNIMKWPDYYVFIKR